MAKIFSVSLQNGDLELIKWITERQAEGTLPSPSLIFRDAMMEKKREWDIMNSENPLALHKRIEDMSHVITKQSNFINSLPEELQDQFLKLMNKQIPKLPQLKEINGKTIKVKA